MNEMLQNEEGDDPYNGDQNGWPLVLLLRVTKANGKPLPIWWVYRKSNVTNAT